MGAELDIALAETIVLAIAGYFAGGGVVALLFMIFGLARIDHAAKGAAFQFRAMIFMGCVVLWPIILVRWLSGRKINQPIEDGR